MYREPVHRGSKILPVTLHSYRKIYFDLRRIALLSNSHVVRGVQDEANRLSAVAVEPLRLRQPWL